MVTANGTGAGAYRKIKSQNKMSKIRAHRKHVYLNIITGDIANPGHGNVSWCCDSTYVSVGYYYTYGTIVSRLDEERMTWVVSRGSKTILECKMSEEQIAEREQKIAEDLQRRHELAKQTAYNNSERGMKEAIDKSLTIIEDHPAPSGDSRYYINGYYGCGVYRVWWSGGKIVAMLYGGYHNTCPRGVNYQKWWSAIDAAVEGRYPGAVCVKMDGSCTDLFFRDYEDSELVDNQAKVYAVPHYLGGTHINIQANLS